MSTVTFNPAKTETTVVEVAPATVTLVVTLDDAAKLRALVGKTTPGSTGLHRQLTDLADAGLIENLRAADKAGERVPTLHFYPR